MLLRSSCMNLMGYLVAGFVVAIAPVFAADADPALVEKGRYLATAGDCTACHNDPKSGEPFAGGYGVHSPMGTIYGSNITPSTKYGIGGWTLEQFQDAVRKGVAPGNHYLYPAMPYTAFSGVSDEDMKALYSYFMLGVKPVEHDVEKTDLGFPFNIRLVMMGWNLLYRSTGVVSGADAPAGSVERGRYLAETLLHCSTCHTPRNMMMAEDSSRYLAGGRVGSWVAPNITSDKVSGIGTWSEDEIVQYLKTGVLHGKAVAGGEMGVAVQNSFSRLTDDDLNAVAAYIKSVPAINAGEKTSRFGWKHSNSTPAADVERPLDPTNIDSYVSSSDMTGAELYNGACATCHGYDGRGTADGKLPSLVGLSTVGSSDPSNLVMTIADGLNRQTTSGHAFMPAFRPQFSDEQIARVADYVATAFGDPEHRISAKDVENVFASASEKNWLIANAGLLTIFAIIVGIAVIGLLCFQLLSRRKYGLTTSDANNQDRTI